jgi:aryl-alcohol dehydrogenase-like predicted oxidoreductase
MGAEAGPVAAVPAGGGATGNGRELGGSFVLGPWRVRRAGYGAMHLAGDGVFGPPRDRDEALRVLRAAVPAGVDHIDTAQFYGAGTVNELIREALHPYPDGLAIVTKVGAGRDGGGASLRSWTLPLMCCSFRELGRGLISPRTSPGHSG